jgi:hypothetical protein
LLSWVYLKVYPGCVHAMQGALCQYPGSRYPLVEAFIREKNRKAPLNFVDPPPPNENCSFLLASLNFATAPYLAHRCWCPTNTASAKDGPRSPKRKEKLPRFLSPSLPHTVASLHALSSHIWLDCILSIIAYWNTTKCAFKSAVVIKSAMLLPDCQISWRAT